MASWRIYYDTGETYDGPIETAPAWGVIAVVCAPDVWHGGDYVGLIDYLARPGWKRVLFGRLVPNDVFEKVSGAAAHDPDRGEGWQLYYGDHFYWYEG